MDRENAAADAGKVHDFEQVHRNEKLAEVWAEAIRDLRVNGLEPSERLLGYIEANIRGELGISDLIKRVVSESLDNGRRLN